MREMRTSSSKHHQVTGRVAGIATVLTLFAACSDAPIDAPTASGEEQALAGGELSLFGGTSKPGVASDPDTAAVEIGVRIKVDADGFLNGVRFYKGAGNTGIHVAHLWTNSGTLLKTQTFSGETASGWQTVRFASPVSVKAGSLLVASYHTDKGHYAGDNGYFNGRGVDNGPLHAPADSAQGHNGVYRYGAAAFPSDSYAASNYWVDVFFKPAITGTDGGTTTDSGATADSGPPPSGMDAGPAAPPDAGATTTVAHGKDISAANTGVPAGVSLVAQSGTVTLSTAGAVYDGKDLTGNIVVAADNVTIRNCKVRSDDYFAIKKTSGKNTLIESCEIFSPSGAYTGIVGDDMVVRRCNLHNFENAIIAGDSDVIEENYIHDLYYGPGAHVDGVEWGGSGSGSTVRRNRILLGGDTGCVNVTPYSGGVANNNTIQDNLFSGGSYSLYIRGDGGGTVSGVTVTGNIWVKGSYAYGTHSVVAASGIVWSGNQLDDGTVVAP